MQAPQVVAEIGCNHRGELDTAIEMIRVAANFAQVDSVKFQKRNPRELLSKTEYDAIHPNPHAAYGTTYGDHREALEFSAAQHGVLKSKAEEFGVEYSSSVWDQTSAREIMSLEPKTIKIPSACNLNRPLLALIADEFGGEIHISLGMTTQREEDEIVNFLVQKNRAQNAVLYSCTSGYPVSFEDICLLEIERLKKKFDGTVQSIGFSGHHLGIAVDIVAMSLGVSHIERHFTLDRTWKGTDHAASLEPDGLRKLARDLRHVALAMSHKHPEILEVEKEQREKLKQGQIRW